MKQTKPIDPKKLSGPRSFFTDIDPRDPDYQEKEIERKLKLQLLTKDRIVIAASSLFHEIGYNLFSKDAGLISSLESGIILPAVRKEFESIQGFFESKKGYSQNSKDFFYKYCQTICTLGVTRKFKLVSSNFL